MRVAPRHRFGETGNTVSPAAIPGRPRISFLLTCPNCGSRDVNEFAYAGEVTTRPTTAPSLRELTDYVYFRRNVAGVQREWWHHRFGCDVWFLAERDTRTNEVLRVALPDAPEPKAAPDPVVPDTPAA